MPIIQFKSCTVEGDLAQALLDLQQHIGETSESLTQSINGIESSQTELNAIDSKLNEILQYSPTPTSPTQIATEVGIPLPFSTTKDDEIRLEQHGLILINGIVWKKGTDSNISNFRRLFFAVGEDLNRFFTVLNSEKGFVVVQRKLNVYKLPQKSSWNVEEARESFNNYSIEKVYQKGSDYYAVVLTYLTHDKSKDQTALQFDLSLQDIITDVFWINEIKNDVSTLNKLKNLGIQGSYLSSVIVGKPFSELRGDLVDSSILNLNQQRIGIISQINFLAERMSSLNTTEKASLKNEILKSITLVRKEASLFQQYVRFNSSIVPQRTALDTFLTKNSEDDLVYLFRERRSVQSIDFSADTVDVVERIRQVLVIPVGSTTTSTLLLNSNFSEITSLVDKANFEAVKFLCAETKVSATDYTYISLQIAASCLSDDYMEATQADPVIGYPSYDSPATILQRNANWYITLNIDAIYKALEGLAGSVAEVLRPLVSAITAANRSAQTAIDKFFFDLNNKVTTEIRNIESFMSKYMGFFGTTTVESSLLKCALGFNLNSNLPFLNDISALVEALREKVKLFLAQIMEIVGIALEELIALPARLINQMLKNVEDFLPSYCKVSRVSLPPDVESKLGELSQNSQIQTTSSVSFNQSLARLKTAADSLPTKFETFKQGVSLQDETGSRFLKEVKKSADASSQSNLITSAIGSLVGL